MRTSSRRIAGRLLILVALVLAGVLLVPALLGFERYVITGASMTGTYDSGSLVYARGVPVSELEVGDVITYDPPARSGVEGLVTHRIVAIREDGGRRLYRTRGDANRAVDPWRLELAGPTQARAEFAVPYLGYAFAALDVRAVRIALIGVPALLIAIAALIRFAGATRTQRPAVVRDA